MIYLIFTGLQLANVILSTIRSVVTIKGNKILASVVSAIYFAFYVLVILYTVEDFNLYIKMGITFAVNLIGTYIGRTLTDNCKKEKWWEIKGIVDSKSCDNILAQLSNLEWQLPVIVTDIHITTKLITIFTKTKDESRAVREIFKAFNVNSIVHEQDVQL